MEIRIALTNLGKYNEGELIYTWLDLPATDEEISEAIKEINVAPNTEYEEYFISDYGAPFSVSEYESLTKLNEIAEQLSNVELPEKRGVAGHRYYDAGDAIALAHRLEEANFITNAVDYVGNIVDDDSLNEKVKQAVEDGGWQRVKGFLSGVDGVDDYYYINGYANAETLTNNKLEAVMSDLIDEMKRSIDE